MKPGTHGLLAFGQRRARAGCRGGRAKPQGCSSLLNRLGGGRTPPCAGTRRAVATPGSAPDRHYTDTPGTANDRCLASRSRYRLRSMPPVSTPAPPRASRICHLARQESAILPGRYVARRRPLPEPQPAGGHRTTARRTPAAREGMEEGSGEGAFLFGQRKSRVAPLNAGRTSDRRSCPRPIRAQRFGLHEHGPHRLLLESGG